MVKHFNFEAKIYTKPSLAQIPVSIRDKSKGVHPRPRGSKENQNVAWTAPCQLLTVRWRFVTVDESAGSALYYIILSKLILIQRSRHCLFFFG
ncbi:hypothetical protein DKX38_013970 [Salix brachista]|uniref:Uncharacterized protein n=1 Tax=Salix brachista TaxID=2182728 RepID=A0A5N5LGA1_9ROSI|nr:hypothetical protein DKX38_013970 [Salix brachista]